MFPTCFPAHFEEKLLPVKEEDSVAIHVYRILKSGKLDRDAFLSSWEEFQRNLVPTPRNADDPSSYGTSCTVSLKQAQYMCNMFMKFYPKPEIALGHTVVNLGPSQFSYVRNQDAAKNHVDWWIYQESQPQNHFHIIEKEESL